MPCEKNPPPGEMRRASVARRELSLRFASLASERRPSGTGTTGRGGVAGSDCAAGVGAIVAAVRLITVAGAGDERRRGRAAGGEPRHAGRSMSACRGLGVVATGDRTTLYCGGSHGADAPSPCGAWLSALGGGRSGSAAARSRLRPGCLNA